MFALRDAINIQGMVASTVAKPTASEEINRHRYIALNNNPQLDSTATNGYTVTHKAINTSCYVRIALQLPYLELF